MDRLSESIWHGAPFMHFGMCKDGWIGPEYKHLDREQYGKLEDSVDIKPGGTWDSRHQKRNLSRRLTIAITACDHHDTTVIDSKGHKSWLPTQERRMQDQSSLWMTWSYMERYPLVQTVWGNIGMKFGCAVLELERGRLVRREGIELLKPLCY